MRLRERLFARHDERVVTEMRRLSHCHLCGACICYQHEALAHDDWDQQRVICERCATVGRAP